MTWVEWLPGHDSGYGTRMTRHIDFDGIENFPRFRGLRDTQHGRPPARGLLYRSANHAYASRFWTLSR